MSEILKKIKSDFIAARREKDRYKIDFYSTIIGEIENASVIKDGEKIVTDEIVIQKLKSTAKKCEELLVISKISESALSKAAFEHNLAVSYLPVQMGEDELRYFFQLSKENDPTINLGGLMSNLKANFAGRYDGKLASQIAKEFA